MRGQKIYLGTAIRIDNRLLYPIISLKVLKIDNFFCDIDYNILAFKIIENDLVYFKNVNLSEKDFEIIKKKIK